MGNISQNTLLLTLLFIVTILTTTNNAQVLLPQVSSPSPSPSPSHAPSPSHHNHNHIHHHHHNHSPALAPSPSPSSPPPAAHHDGVKRQLVAVQGMVYCNTNCSTAAAPHLSLLASPLPGARVVLRCRNTQYLLRKTATTDKNGYFFMEAPAAVTSYGAHKCKVYLARRPNGPSSCTNATNLNNGLTGAYLYSNNTGPPNTALPHFSLFSVGPFAYASATCHRQ
ncbi:hypothetical protein vseg_017478 [Gypsophila vaccaria]